MIQVIGVDPGPTTGIGIIRPSGITFLQCHHELAIPALEWIIASWGCHKTVIGQERYVMSLKASKLNNAKASQITRDINGAIMDIPRKAPYVVLVEHRAVDWKPWATLERLEKSGINRIGKGSTHARDGMAISLYTAVCHCDYRDPLSNRPQPDVWLAPTYQIKITQPAAGDVLTPEWTREP